MSLKFFLTVAEQEKYLMLSETVGILVFNEKSSILSSWIHVDSIKDMRKRKTHGNVNECLSHISLEIIKMLLFESPGWKFQIYFPHVGKTFIAKRGRVEITDSFINMNITKLVLSQQS